MNNIRKIARTVFFGILFVFLLTGCSGSTVDTSLTINEDLSGCRAIDMSVTKSNIDEYVQGTEADVESCLEKALPSDLSYTVKEQEDKVVFHFDLEFDSVSDYEKKVEAITDKDVNISISISDSVWTSGIFIEEDFESQDLLEWFKQALVDEELISESNGDSLFGSGSTQVVYGNETYSCSSRIRVDETVTQGIDSIDVLTTVKGLDNFDRKIIFKVPESSMNENGAKISEYMKSLAKSGMTFEETKEDSMTVFSYEAKSLNMSDLETFMKTIFGKDNVTLSKEEPQGTDSSAFSFYSLFIENVKFTDFVVGNATTYCNYYTAINNEFQVRDTRNMGFYGDDYESYQYPGYADLKTGFYVRSDSVLELAFMIKRSLVVDTLNISTERKGSKWKRQIEIGFEDEVDEEVRDLVLERINSKYQEDIQAAVENEEASEEDFGNVEVKGNEKDGFWKLLLEQKGTSEQMNRSTTAIFSTYGEMAYGYDHGIFKVKKKVCYIDRLDISQFLGNVGEDFESHYRLKTGLLTTYVYATTDSGEASHNKNVYEVTDFGTRLDVRYVGEEIDIFAALFIGFLILSILFVLIAVLKSGILSTKKKNEIGYKQGVDFSVKNGEKKFCKKCGEALNPDAKFCSRCGETTVH